MLISNYISPKPLVKKIAILSGSLIIMLLSIFTLGFHGNNKRVVESTGTIIAYGGSGGIVGNGSGTYAWLLNSNSNHSLGASCKKNNLIVHIKVSQNKLLIQKI